MAIKLKSFDTLDYFHVCGMHMKRFGAGVKGNVRIDYHHPHGVMVHRDGKTSEFVPIHNIKTVTPTVGTNDYATATATTKAFRRYTNEDKGSQTAHQSRDGSRNNGGELIV